MIELYSGTPGSGKSLRAAMVIAEHLRDGWPVIANFDIRTDRIRRRWKRPPKFYPVDNEDLSPADLVQYARLYWGDRHVREDKILLVIDEAQLLFNAREWGKAGRKDWLSFFSQHRKYGFNVILIAQFDSMLDRQIRSLIEYEYIHRKISNFGWRGRLLSLLLGGRAMVAVKVWYPLRTVVGSKIYRVRSRYYRLYDTYSDFGALVQ